MTIWIPIAFVTSMGLCGIGLWLYSRCRHAWEVHDEIRVDNSDHDGSIYKRYHLRCTKCGEMTKRDMK